METVYDTTSGENQNEDDTAEIVEASLYSTPWFGSVRFRRLSNRWFVPVLKVQANREQVIHPGSEGPSGEPQTEAVRFGSSSGYVSVALFYMGALGFEN